MNPWALPPDDAVIVALICTCMTKGTNTEHSVGRKWLHDEYTIMGDADAILSLKNKEFTMIYRDSTTDWRVF